jgi:hypothetical protein
MALLQLTDIGFQLLVSLFQGVDIINPRLFLEGSGDGLLLINVTLLRLCHLEFNLFSLLSAGFVTEFCLAVNGAFKDFSLQRQTHETEQTKRTPLHDSSAS